MAGFGGSTSTYGGRAGSFNTRSKPAANSLPGSFTGSRSAGPQLTPEPTAQRTPRGGGAGPQIQQAGPGRTPGGGSRGAPISGRLPPPKPVTISPPKPAGQSRIDITAERNPDLDRLRDEQRENIENLKSGTGFAADVLATRTADAFEGAKNAAKYAGGEGASGVRDTRQQQLTDTQLRAQAGNQANLALGREGMVTSAIQGQLPGLMGQQAGMLGQQGIGLQAEGLRQQGQQNQFSQGLAGQQFGADVQFRNQQLANQAAGQQLQALQGAQNIWGDAGGGYGGWGGGGGGGYAPRSRNTGFPSLGG